jgi:hypothetical protein
MWQIVTNGGKKYFQIPGGKWLTDAYGDGEGTGLSESRDPDGLAGREEQRTKPLRCAGVGSPAHKPENIVTSTSSLPSLSLATPTSLESSSFTHHILWALPEALPLDSFGCFSVDCGLHCRASTGIKDNSKFRV